MAVIVLDASVVIAFLDSSDAHHASAVAALAAHQSEQLVLPASTYAEILVGPYRRGPRVCLQSPHSQMSTEPALLERQRRLKTGPSAAARRPGGCAPRAPSS